MSAPARSRQRLRNYLFLTLIIVVGSPLAVLSIFHAYSYSATYREQVSSRLNEAAVGIGDGVDDYLQHHYKALAFIAAQIQREADFSPQRLELWLRQTGNAYPGLFTMIAVDDKGIIIAQKPLDPEIDKAFGTSPPLLGRSVADREYFQTVTRTRAPYVSNAFRGRGFGAAPIVAVCAPLFRQDGRIIVIEGSLDLQRFLTLDQRYDTIAESPVVIADKMGRVVYASPGFGFEPLEETASLPLAQHQHEAAYKVQSRATGEEFIIGHSVARWSGWHIYIGQPTRLAFRDVRRNYALTAALALGGVLVSLLLATWIAASVTAPMGRLIQSCENFLRGGKREPIPVPPNSPQEVATLVHTFEEMSDRLGKMLSGLLPICAGCKKIRDDQGHWNVLETYITSRTEAKLTHGLCPSCAAEYLPLDGKDETQRM